LKDPPLWRDLMRCERLYNRHALLSHPARFSTCAMRAPTAPARGTVSARTGMLVPIALWGQVGRFRRNLRRVSTTSTTRLRSRRRDLRPIYARAQHPLAPFTQSIGESRRRLLPPARGATPRGAFQRKFGRTLTGFWHSNWEERWARNRQRLAGTRRILPLYLNDFASNATDA